MFGLRPRRREVVQRVEPRLDVPAETRSADTELRFGNLLDGVGALSMAQPLAPHWAENLSAVLGAAELTSSAIASLPPLIQVDGPNGREPAPDSATAWRLLERPNPRQSWPSFMTQMVAELLLKGNAVAVLITDARGAIIGITCVPWHWLLPQIINGGGGKRLAYEVVNTFEGALLELPKRLLDSDVMHVLLAHDNGVVGRSVLSRAHGVVAEGREIQTLAQSNWSRGMRPSGALSIDGVLPADQRERMRALLDKLAGAQNAGRYVLLEAGMKWQPFGMSSIDAEFLASRQFSVAEIARLFCIPEPMLQIGPRPPSDMPAIIAAFAMLALSPIVAAVEAEFDHAVLPPGYHLQLDMSGLLRGNYSAVMAANAVAVQSGIFSPNDARRAVGLPAHEDGDGLRGGSPPSWPADGKGMPALHPAPGRPSAGDVLPNVGTHQGEGAG
jgi:HK97 family phage portal protein